MKKLDRTLLAVLLCAVLFALYLFAALRPGIWLRDAFLYQQKDGSLSGKDRYGTYEMTSLSTPDGVEVEFSFNETTEHYKIQCSTDKNSVQKVEIYQNNTLRFSGTAQGDPGDAILWKQDGGLADDVHVIVNGEHTREDLLPSCQWLYNAAIGRRRETRGNLGFLFGMAGLGLLLALDLKWPLLFWNLRHGLEVDGGEPSDWYYTSQKWGRAAIAAGIVGLMVASFWVH